MKIFFATLFIMTLLCASTCKKDNYTCDCVTSGGTNGGYAVQNEDLGEISTTDANNQCISWLNEQQANLSAAGGTATVNCFTSAH